MRTIDVLIPVRDSSFEMSKNFEKLVQVLDGGNFVEAGVLWGRITQLAANIQGLDVMMRDCLYRDQQDSLPAGAFKK